MRKGQPDPGWSFGCSCIRGQLPVRVRRLSPLNKEVTAELRKFDVPAGWLAALFIILLLTGCQSAAPNDEAMLAAGGIEVSGEAGWTADAGPQPERENATESDGNIPGTGGESPGAEPSHESSNEPSEAPRKEPVRIPVVIYALTDDILRLPVSSIPYYDKGRITFWSEDDLKAPGKRPSGHKTGIDDVIALTSNLTGREDAELDWTAGAEGERRTSKGLVMKETADRRYELFVPDIGKYDIELENPSGHEVPYITKITWHPIRGAEEQPAELREARSIVFYELPEEVFKRPRTGIPYYKRGAIEYTPEYVFDQYEEGHQPWLGTGIDVATVMTGNLPGQEKPYQDLEETHPGYHFKLSTPDGIVMRTVTNEFIQLKVPELGTYDIEMTGPPKTIILFISKITLRLNDYS